jgi:hypothetical protein
MNPAIEALLRPKSIAILGTSADFQKLNGRTLKALLEKGYAGQIYPVNPKYGHIATVCSCSRWHKVTSSSCSVSNTIPFSESQGVARRGARPPANRPGSPFAYDQRSVAFRRRSWKSSRRARLESVLCGPGGATAVAWLMVLNES